MKTEQAHKHYGSNQAIANVVGVTKQAVQLWKEYPPPEPQMRIHKNTGGKLKAEPAVLKFYRELTEGVL